MSTFVNPTLITITAPTCAGKSFLIDRVQSELQCRRLITSTSRHPRPNEINGVSYWFTLREKFVSEPDSFAEINEFCGNFYGLSKTELNEVLVNGIAVVILDPSGLEKIKKVSNSLGIDVFSIFIHLTEEKRIARLEDRCREEMYKPKPQDLPAVLKSYQNRLISIRGDERRWLTQHIYDCIVPGDDIEKAMTLIHDGASWRNRRIVNQHLG